MTFVFDQKPRTNLFWFCSLPVLNSFYVYYILTGKRLIRQILGINNSTYFYRFSFKSFGREQMAMETMEDSGL